MSKITLRVGPPVVGDNFFGREKELIEAWDNYISKGISILLSAPRRVGKSSFSKRMIKIAEEKQWKTLYLDLQGISTEYEFVELVKTELRKNNARWKNIGLFIGDTVLKLLESIGGSKIKGNEVSFKGAVWRNNTYEKIRQIFKNDENVLIVIDELAVFLTHLINQEKGREKTEIFLEWLRKFRQTTKVCWILCSSIGIDNFAHTNQLSKHLNDVYRFRIGEFNENEAKEFILRLDVDKNIKFTDEQIQYILNKLTWHLPFFIQLFVNQINILVSSEGKSFCKETIDNAYNMLITGNQFDPWIEKLKEYRELEKTAREVLNLCAISDGKSKGNILASLSAKKKNIEELENMLSELLVMLFNDGFLIENKGKYKFRSPLLKDFWYGRFVKK